MPPAPGLQSGRVGCSQNGLVELPGRAAVVALEEHARRAARVEMPVVLCRHDRPEPLQRQLRVLGQLDPGRLLPLGRTDRPCRRSSARRRRRSRMRRSGRCARRASRTRRARRRTRATSRRTARRPSPSSTNRPFFVPTSSCVISSSRDRGEHVQPVLFGPTAVSSRPYSLFTKTLMCSRISPRSSRIQPFTSGCSRSRACSTSPTVDPSSSSSRFPPASSDSGARSLTTGTRRS